jgi:F0F1-type ATP synthase beta subunit
MRSNEYTRRRLRNKYTDNKNNPTSVPVTNDSKEQNLKRYHELIKQAESEQDPIEKVTLEQRAEHFKKLAENK